ncbi:MAG: relaxase MobL [Hydrogeniiclostridium mannosilyticum]
MSKEGIRQIKSRLTNDIFRDEMLHLYEQKSASRDELVRQARRAMLELVQAMQGGLCDHPEAERLMQELAVQLGTVKGKKTYGYLPKRLKGLVDEIDQMERFPSCASVTTSGSCSRERWTATTTTRPGSGSRSTEKEFRQIKNAVIREAERLRLGQITFEDQDMGQRDEPEQFRNASYAYWMLQEVIRNEELTLEERSGAVSELEKLAKGGDRYSQYLLGKLWRDGPLLIPDGVNASVLV